MKRLVTTLLLAVLLVVPAAPTMAGQIGSPGYTEPQGETPSGCEWIQLLDGLWYLFTN